jgi:phage terminase large subunit GpA-like protein
MYQTLKKDRQIWGPEEQSAWRRPAKITVSQWSDFYRILNPLTSAEPGRWRTSRTPYLQGIMDAFSDPYVEEITVMAASQVGKTEAMLNMLGFIIDQDPGPTLMVLPRESDAKSFSYNRVMPMFECSYLLQEHLPKVGDDITKLEYHLSRMILYFAGSNSPADLASRPIRFLFLDEVDKYPRFSGREADPIKLASERQKTFWNKKTVKVSTPTTREGYIHREFEKSDRRRFYVPCVHCGKYQILIFGQIKWPQEVPSEVIKNERLAWYECLHCGQSIKDYEKNKMLLGGRWIPEGAEIDNQGNVSGEVVRSKHRGFWINSLYSPWLTWSDIAAEFLKSKDSIELLMNFVNSWLAEVWEENLGKSKPDEIKALALNYAKGTVPAEAMVLTAGVDVQKDHFYVVIRAWGLQQRSWLILATRLETQNWDEVKAFILDTLYPSENPSDDPWPVRLACVDTGYRTDEAYDFCRKHGFVARPVKGKDYLDHGIPFKVSKIDKFPSGKPIPGGLQLWHIDTTYFKDKLIRMIKNTETDILGGWRVYKGVSDEYCIQMCSEHKVIIRDRKTGKSHEEWRKVTSHASNHYWDCEVAALAAAEMLHVFSWTGQSERKVYQPREKESSFYGQGKWIERRPNWIRRNG